jgi:succinate dehydrogenase / fumarate reductase iron-sulfur subunit
MARTLEFRIFRGDAKVGAEETYKVDAFPGMVVLDAIHVIQQEQDGSLACRWNCKAAKCGSCSAEINGKPGLLCKARVDDFGAGEVIHVAPLKTFPIVKDLVTDVSWTYEVSKTIDPLTLSESDSRQPLRMQQMDVDRMLPRNSAPNVRRAVKNDFASTGPASETDRRQRARKQLAD